MSFKTENRQIEDKQNVYSMEYYSALKKELSTNTCYNMDKPWKHATWNKPDTKGQDTAWFHLY